MGVVIGPLKSFGERAAWLSTTLENEAMATVQDEARQIGWVISVKDWALIRRLVAEGVPQRQVARDLGIGRSTVERALALDRRARA